MLPPVKNISSANNQTLVPGVRLWYSDGREVPALIQRSLEIVPPGPAQCPGGTAAGSSSEGIDRQHPGSGRVYRHLQRHSYRL